MSLFFVVGLVLVGLALVSVAVFYFFKKREIHSLDLRLMRISMPREEKKEDADLHKEINISEQLFSSLLSIRVPFSFEVAVHHSGEEIYFYVAVPLEKKDFVARQIQGLFPDARVDEVGEYNIFSPTGGAAGAYLSLDKSPFLPIRSYEESEVDTFAQILSNMSKLQDVGEGAAVQVLVRPAPDFVLKNSLSAIEQLKKGGKLKDILKRSLISVKDVTDTFKTKKDSDKPEAKIIDEEAVKVLQSKISKPLFSVNVRIISSGESRDRAEDILMSLGGTYAQFAGPLRNEIKVVKPRDLKRLFYQFSFREFDENHVLHLNAAELAGLFHLPTFTTKAPRIKWLNTKESEPPQSLPSEGVVIGESVFRGERKLVRLTPDDRRRHLYVIGQTGTGKSGLMINSVVQDMEDGKGVCVIDPHGELIDDVLARVPKDRIDDIIVFDPGDIERPVALNMLEFDASRPEQKTFIVNEMQAIFNRLFSQETMGPMFEQYMRNSLLLLMEDMPNEPATLVEIPRLFTDVAFRQRKLARIKNPTVIDFWEKEASKVTGEASLANMAPYITSKFGNFISNDYVRPIIGQPKSSFNFRQIMDENKILLVNLSKGRIGDINANLLGMVITGRILMAALSRVDQESSSRKDFYFYIDEFQNFTTDSIAVILSEARKYKLNLTLAHQFIDQLTDEIREAVFGNVGSMVSFRVGVPDTEQLVKQFGPEFNEKDLINIENRNAFVRLLIKGQPSRPFNMKTIDFKPGSREVRDKLKELSRLTYGRPNREIENEILARLRN